MTLSQWRVLRTCRLRNQQSERVPSTVTVTAVTPDGRSSTPLTFTIEVAAMGRSAEDLRITEYQDLGNEEWIEITNLGQTPVNLADYRLQDFVTGAPHDDDDGDGGTNVSFIGLLPSGTLNAGESALLWTFGAARSFNGELFFSMAEPTRPKLESAGDDIWLIHDNGLIADYAGWYDSAYAGGIADEWSGAPPAYLDLCPTTDANRPPAPLM